MPFLSNASDSFISTIITKLHFEVYLPGDYIVRHGTLGHHMYFVQEGSVDVITREGTTVTSLAEGSYFGGVRACACGVMLYLPLCALLMPLFSYTHRDMPPSKVPSSGQCTSSDRV